MRPVADSPVLPLQRAMHHRYTEDVELMALLSGLGVYDQVDENTTLDYVVLGEAYSLPDNDHEGFGAHVVPTLHIWTRSRGFTSGLEIERRLRQLTDHQPSAFRPDGHRVVAVRFEYLQTLRTPNPEIRHVTARYRFTTEQE